MPGRDLLLVLAAFALTMPAAHAAECTPHSVSVSGKGSVSAAPGVYTFHVSVSRRGTDVRAESAAVDKLATAAVKAARAAGLADADIRSTAVTVNPVYNSDAKPEAPRVFEVRRDLVLTLRNPSRYAQLVQGLVQAGINGIGNIVARPADPAAVADRALTAAVADARHKAALIAKGLGVALGPALSVNENGQGPRPLVMGERINSENKGYEPGTITVRASVAARFALSPSGCPQQ